MIEIKLYVIILITVVLATVITGVTLKWYINNKYGYLIKNSIRSARAEALVDSMYKLALTTGFDEKNDEYLSLMTGYIRSYIRLYCKDDNVSLLVEVPFERYVIYSVYLTTPAWKDSNISDVRERLTKVLKDISKIDNKIILLK